MRNARPLMVRAGAVVGAAALMLAASAAQAATTVPLDSQELTGASATWDVSSPYDYGSGGAPCTSSTGGYTPVEDGSFAGASTYSDAFDAGLYLNVNGSIFDDADGNGRLSGQQLTAGPTNMSGLQVTRIERALSTSPTLRSLVRFKNGSAKRSEGIGIDGLGRAVLEPHERAERGARRERAFDPGHLQPAHVGRPRGELLATEPAIAVRVVEDRAVDVQVQPRVERVAVGAGTGE